MESKLNNALSPYFDYECCTRFKLSEHCVRVLSRHLTVLPTSSPPSDSPSLNSLLLLGFMQCKCTSAQIFISMQFCTDCLVRDSSAEVGRVTAMTVETICQVKGNCRTDQLQQNLFTQYFGTQGRRPIVVPESEATNLQISIYSCIYPWTPLTVGVFTQL